MGNAEGGDWKPKKPADERFLGEPNTINRYHNAKGELYETKISNDGKASIERHHSTHNREHTYHTNPHDHIIDWSTGRPSLGPPINYPDGSVPELKHYAKENMMIIYGNSDDLRFENISDFKWSLVYGGEIEFEWNGIQYGAFRDEDEENGGYKYFLFEVPDDDKGIYFATPDELLDHTVQGNKLREIITNVTVTSRAI